MFEPWSWKVDTHRQDFSVNLPPSSHFSIETREDGRAKVTLSVVFEPPPETRPHAGSPLPHRPIPLQALSEQLLVECATQLLASRTETSP